MVCMVHIIIYTILINHILHIDILQYSDDLSMKIGFVW